MKIINKKTVSRKKMIIILVLFVTAIICTIALDRFGILTILPKTNPIPDISQEPSIEEKETESSYNSTEKESFLDSIKDSQTQGINVPTPTTNSNISLAVNNDGDNMTIIVKLKEHGFSEGQCSLSVSANNRVVEQSARIIYQPEYSTCAGFSVPISSLGNGLWDIKLSVTPINGTTITLSEIKEV